MKKEEISFFKNMSFEEMCNKIEKDLNYQPSITNEELMSLVKDEDGKPKHSPRKSALAIQPSLINIPLSNELDSVGKIYQIKMTIYGDPFGSGWSLKNWYLNDEVVILVKKNGETLLCSREDAEQGIFKVLERNFQVEDFLNQPSLHQPEELLIKTSTLGSNN